MTLHNDTRTLFEQNRSKTGKVLKTKGIAGRHNGFNTLSPDTVIQQEIERVRARLLREPSGQVKRLVVDGKATCPEGEALLHAKGEKGSS